MGYNEIARRSVYQHYPQNMIHTFDTEHLCQSQCHVPCSMKHINDLMMQRWLCPVKVINFVHSFIPQFIVFLLPFNYAIAVTIILIKKVLLKISYRSFLGNAINSY